MKNDSSNRTTIVISRTDSIGDVVLTLPLCGAIKEKFPDSKLIFLAASYTIPVVECCSSIDEIWDYTDLIKKSTEDQLNEIQSKGIDVFVHVFPRKNIARLVKKAKIASRIGTSHRAFHWLTCNQKVNFTRKNSPLHEAQLNFHLLKPLGIHEIPPIDKIASWNNHFNPKNKENRGPSPSFGKKKVILHPKSQGSAIEWPLEKYQGLAMELIAAGCVIYVTGTEKEGEQFRGHFQWNDSLIDTSGTMTLSELIGFISSSDLLIACSTGPLHIAAVLEKNCIGLFSPRRPIHPGRWMPIGKKAEVLVSRNSCLCKSKEMCDCLQNIEVETVLAASIKHLNG